MSGVGRLAGLVRKGFILTLECQMMNMIVIERGQLVTEYLGHYQLEILALIMNNPIDQFIQGQRDCRDGLPAKSQDEDYINGYSFQYQCEANATYMADKKEKEMQL